MSNIFIAPKIRVGFQSRSDCFTGKLAYIIYYDTQGKIRKETSWNSWRDKKIAPLEFDNKPMDGFTINKDIKRYHGGWFSSNRTMVRIHDPRGFEFEVTTENLIAILMHTDCLRRGLIGEFVYAWSGTDLILLPTNSEEYNNGQKYTEGLGKRVSVKDLIPGISYKTKRKGDVVYLGRFSWFEYSGKYTPKGVRKEYPKALVFTEDNGKTFFRKDSTEFLSCANTTDPVSDYALLVDRFNKTLPSRKITLYEMVKVEPDLTIHPTPDGEDIKNHHYFRKYTGENTFTSETIHTEMQWVYNKRVVKGFRFHSSWYVRASINLQTGQITDIEGNRSAYYSYYTDTPVLTEA